MNFSKIYRRLAEVPVFTSISFASRNQISIETSVRDHVNNTKRTFVQEVAVLDGDSGSSSSPSKFWLSTPTERAESIVARLVSPSGSRTAILKETSSTPKKRFVEIWCGERAELILETTSRHGSFYADATFSSLCFSPKEDAILYTAEANAPEADPKDPFKKFRFEQSYGELFIDRRRPTLFWLRWDRNSKNTTVASKLIQVNPTIETLPQSLAGDDKLGPTPPVYSLGQATFASSSGLGVIATAYLRTKGDRKLGIVYCTNRPSMIVGFTLPTDIPLQTEEKSVEEKEKDGVKEEKKEVSVICTDLYSDYPCRSPRVWFPTEEQAKSNGSDSPVAVWISNHKEPHGSCTRLHMAKLSLQDNQFSHLPDAETIVDSVWEPSKHVDKGGFPGLYINQLPTNPFLFLDGRLHLACISSWGCTQPVVIVRLEKDAAAQKDGIFPLYPGNRRSVGLVACDGGLRIAIAGNDLLKPNELFVADLIGSNLTSDAIKNSQVTSLGQQVSDLFEGNEETGILDIRGQEPTQTVWIKKSGNQVHMTWAHGGPHSVTPTSFSAEAVAFLLSGYNISFPNYRGSLGYGQRWVEELLGKIGTLDVEDVMASTKQMIGDGLVEGGPKTQVYMGGSHGGFLGAHVIGQFPEFFAACVLRNPVVNIPTSYATTDIPDWSAVESGTPYDPTKPLAPKQYEDWYKLSPIQYVDKVITPVLLRMGDIDQRVPPSQGREYYHLLKAKGLGEDVEMLWFPENGHALDKVEAEREGWDATLAWYRKYGKTDG